MVRTWAATVGVVVIGLLVAVGINADAVQSVAAQAPTIGATNTAAAQTAIVGVTAISASDAPPTPTVPSTPPATPVLTPTPVLRPTSTGSPIPNPALAATILSSSGSAVALGTPVAASPAGGTGGSSMWPVIGVLVIIAAVVAAGIAWTLTARSARRSRGG